ncbi:EF-hand domain-containing protein [Pontiella sulfatireligans]|uniref:Uncharacterized protein n=1 Tax=Pontiella sulfatireligans TaxID=2750658 RepID=A0A6C2UE50_9BACT|nr:hypothetical protein [Pontiella sulfatireligans]VGO18492.1 hypothetical protein SCARR_00545 [Pontiella sulfatireligans]
MKVWLTVLLIAASATLVEAAKGDSTKEQFMATQQKNAEAKGMKFDAKKTEKMFEQLDANGDGIASGDEKKAYWSKGSAKPAPAPRAAPVAKKTHVADQTKAEFVASQKVRYESKGWKFNQATVEKMFVEIDVNKDGLADGKEKKAYWAKQSKK